MSSGEGIRLQSRKIIDLSTNSQSPNLQEMTETNFAESESVGESSVTSVLLK